MTKYSQYRELREKVSAIYGNFEKVSCPALNGDEVVFNKAGLKHLYFKGKIPRPIADQIRRLMVLSHAREAIGKAKNITEYRKEIRNGSIGHFWSIEHTIVETVITVIIRQINTGQKHFFSISPK